ncbi:MAG: DUF938 domain-containing protein [Burkholderiales bacterium]|nr:DUF938 domain-containing protein [Burkholderiales bacterium]
MSQLFSAACERNSQPIAEQLSRLLANCSTVLEIGSGTGQHAVAFAHAMPHLHWQTSDRLESHASIEAWRAESGLPNIAAPLHLHIGKSAWPDARYDAAFTANTCHIMSWQEVGQMFAGIADALNERGLFCIYGPFNYDRQFTSASNQQFDASLRAQAPHMGLRDIEDIVQLADSVQLQLQEDIAMPANNRLLVLMNIAQKSKA